MSRSLMTALALLFLPACAPAPETLAELDDRLADLVDDATRPFGFEPAVAVAVVERGEEVTRLVSGDVVPTSGDAVTGATPLPLASATKIVTTLVVLQLVDEGALSLDDAVALVGAVQRGEVVSDECWRLATLPSARSEDWGLGLEVYEEAGRAVAGHSGGWSVVVAFVPEGEVASVSLSNVSDRRFLDLGYDVAHTAAQWAGRP